MGVKPTIYNGRVCFNMGYHMESGALYFQTQPLLWRQHGIPQISNVLVCVYLYIYMYTHYTYEYIYIYTYIFMVDQGSKLWQMMVIDPSKHGGSSSMLFFFHERVRIQGSKTQIDTVCTERCFTAEFLSFSPLSLVPFGDPYIYMYTVYIYIYIFIHIHIYIHIYIYIRIIHKHCTSWLMSLLSDYQNSEVLMVWARVIQT